MNTDATPNLVVVTPLRIEAWAVKRALPDYPRLRCGMGPIRARAAAPRIRELPAAAIAIVGLCGALDAKLRPGDIVLASELRDASGSAPSSATEELQKDIEERGLRVCAGPIHCSPHVVRGLERQQLASGGAIAVDMESSWLARAAEPRPVVVLRSVVDTPAQELWSPPLLVNSVRALRALGRALPALARWAEAV